MATDRDRDLARICQSALERPAEQRSAFLAEACGGDDELRLEAESLLASDGQASSFLETPVLADAARGIVEVGPALTIGDRVGPYTVVSPLGTGGMGEVYRARDDRLRRDVAIKILPASFTADPERLARFEREALLLASLNHPNVATIHGIEHAHPIHALVLELVEGDTLAARLRSARRRGSAGTHLPLRPLVSLVLSRRTALLVRGHWLGARDLRRRTRRVRTAAPPRGRPGRGVRAAGTAVLRAPAHAFRPGLRRRVVAAHRQPGNGGRAGRHEPGRIERPGGVCGGSHRVPRRRS